MASPSHKKGREGVGKHKGHLLLVVVAAAVIYSMVGRHAIPLEIGGQLGPEVLTVGLKICLGLQTGFQLFHLLLIPS